MDFSKELANDPELIKRVNKNLRGLKDNFEGIKQLLYKPASDNNFSEAFKRFYLIIDLIPLIKNKLTIPLIARGRTNKIGEPLYNTKAQISYNWANHELIELGRFNRIKEPLFYGVLPTSESLNSMPDAYLEFCARECCKELSDPNNFEFQEITVGGWRIKKPFEVLNLCYDDLHLNYYPDIKEVIDDYFKGVDENLSEESAAFLKVFLKFLSQLSREKSPTNQFYYVLAAFFHAFRYYCANIMKIPIHAIIYPGAMSEAKGLNIAITHSAADEFLSLEKVGVFRFFKIKPEGVIVSNRCSDIIKVGGDKFTITNYNPPGRY